MSENKNIPASVMQVKQRFSIIGNSPELINAIERAVKVAPVDLSVLVTGESGSGKEFFPRIIHASGSRKHKKYIAVNCGAIPEGTIDSELFGHEKGAFTGAISTRKGYFEEADGGTIFLDEVAELPMTTQARLLRVLETGEFLKVGSSEVQKTNVRIVAATNVDLLKAVARGRFREDLYYRLSTIQIQVPSLHDRGEDVLLLARKFASDFAEKYMTAPITFSEEARRAMLLYRWPGNVRQLKNVVEQLALFDAGKEIDRSALIELLPLGGTSAGRDLPSSTGHTYEQDRELLWQTLFSMRAEISELKALLGVGSEISDGIHRNKGLLPSAKDLIDAGDHGGVHIIPEQLPSRGETLEDAERKVIEETLHRNGGDKKKSAEQLNISVRTLYRKIRDYGIES
ncbi:MAG: sigma-54 dependent transcriptional regulator [Muribaculaceae bacterium]|nr:sigma-54 dependent transcriptional regulator [Muribaculaceae bacterium]